MTCDTALSKNNQSLATVLTGVDAMLPMEVYERLYGLMRENQPRHILEIGTAHGAATIAMAVGARAGGNPCRIVTVDALASSADRPSSRARFGDAAANEAIVRGNFCRAGVDDMIDLFIGSSVDAAEAGIFTAPIDVLVLDADGRIDRDLLLFGPLLRNDALVVVDDVDGDAKTTLSPDGTKWVDLKHVISKKLLNEFCCAGLIKETERIRNTVVCRWIDTGSWCPLDVEKRALNCYREIVFTCVNSEWPLNEARKDPKLKEIVVNGYIASRYAGVCLRMLRNGRARLLAMIGRFGLRISSGREV